MLPNRYVNTSCVVGSEFLNGEKRHEYSTYKPISSRNAHTDPLWRTEALRAYRDEYLGILNFFQLNTILEGLENFVFDLRVFFTQGESPIEEESPIQEESPIGEDILKRYSLGSFIENCISVTISPSKYEAEAVASTEAVTEMITSIDKLKVIDTFDDPTTLDNFRSLERAGRSLQDLITDLHIKWDVLRQFLRHTSTSCLQPIKWRLESCRRALLAELFSETNTRSELYQLENPDATVHLTSANEEQMQGYVMLIAAKFPLITNVEAYLREAWARLTKEEQPQIQALWTSWQALREGIEKNLKELEDALEPSTYRIDRRSADEAVHKVHTELTVTLPKEGRLKIHLVYEIRFHRPSGTPGYVLRELRVIAPYHDRLKEEEIRDIQEFVRNHLVHKKVDRNGRFDSLASLSVLDNLPTASTGSSHQADTQEASE